MIRSSFIAIALGLLLAQPVSALAAQCEQTPPSIAVTGTGQISARPDTAEISVGVLTEAPTASRALEMNNKNMERLLAVLVAHQVPDKDVQTQSFSVSPRYRYDKSSSTRSIDGYQVLNRVRVTVRRLDKLGGVLDELVTQGANAVNSIAFSVDNSTALLDQARRQAMADAHRKALLYAGEAGRDLGPVLSIAEHSGTTPGPIRPALAMVRAESVPVAAGELDFRVQVSVTYGLGNAKP